MRVAFCGASGTGKTTLIKALLTSTTLDYLPVNPEGSRSTAKRMGLESAYMADETCINCYLGGVNGTHEEHKFAPIRPLFQQNMFEAKLKWEVEHAEFLTDRHIADQLAYVRMHGKPSLYKKLLFAYTDGVNHMKYVPYTHVFLAPVSVFRSNEPDIHRISEEDYHKRYETVLLSCIKDIDFRTDTITHVHTLNSASLADRVDYVMETLGHRKWSHAE